MTTIINSYCPQYCLLQLDNSIIKATSKR